MEIIDKIKSKKDNVIKYVLRLDDGLITEFSYIDKGDGKDIICVSTQTLCAQGCKFCHVSDHIGKLQFRNLTYKEIVCGVKIVLKDIDDSLIYEPILQKRNCLLVSYMGCGEPCDNVGNVKYSMSSILSLYENKFNTVRFAIATMIPKNRLSDFFDLFSYIHKTKLNVKLHLSLHYTQQKQRSKWMPNALEIQTSIDSVKWVNKYFGIDVEIHYALIAGLNDSYLDFTMLSNYIAIPAKFLYYNEKESLDAEASLPEKYLEAVEIFKEYNVPCEYYVPPGLDIGASCGQFLLDYYEKYNGVTHVK